MAMTSQFSDMASSSIFFDIFSCQVGSGVMTISFYEGLTRNPEIRNTTVWAFPNIWRLDQVRNTKSGANISYKMLLNSAKCQRWSFHRFWVINGKPKERRGRGGGKINPPPILGFREITKQMRLVEKYTLIQ